MLEAIFEYQFLRYAIFAGFFAAIIAGIVGVVINEKKMGMITGGVAHASYGGIGLGYLLNFEPIIGAFIFAISAALGVGVVKERVTGMKDIVIAMFWSVGMSLGILFVALKPGYPPNMSSYLFGNILTVTTRDLWILIAVSVLLLVVTTIYFQEIKAHLFDDEFLAIRERNIKLYERIQMVLIAISVVALIRVVGIILVMSLLSIPAATSSVYTSGLKNRMILSGLLALLFTLVGLFISYITGFPSGATIVLFGFLVFVISWGIKGMGRNKRVNV